MIWWNSISKYSILPVWTTRLIDPDHIILWQRLIKTTHQKARRRSLTREIKVQNIWKLCHSAASCFCWNHLPLRSLKMLAKELIFSETKPLFRIRWKTQIELHQTLQSEPPFNPKKIIYLSATKWARVAKMRKASTMVFVWSKKFWDQRTWDGDWTDG